MNGVYYPLPPADIPPKFHHLWILVNVMNSLSNAQHFQGTNSYCLSHCTSVIVLHKLIIILKQGWSLLIVEVFLTSNDTGPIIYLLCFLHFGSESLSFFLMLQIVYFFLFTFILKINVIISQSIDFLCAVQNMKLNVGTIIIKFQQPCVHRFIAELFFIQSNSDNMIVIALFFSSFVYMFEFDRISGFNSCQAQFILI